MSCQPTPTETQFTTITTDVVSTSFTSSLTTIPGSAITSVSTSCLASATGPSATCISSTLVTAIASAPDTVSTVQIPVITTIPQTFTSATRTLFSTCTDPGVTPNPSPNPSPSPSPSPQPQPPPSSSPTTFTTESSTTLSNGVVVQTTLIVVSTLPPSSVFLPGTQAPSNTQPKKSTNLGPIIGGVVGGVLGLLGIVVLIWFLMRRRSRWDDIFEKDDDLPAVATVRNQKSQKGGRLDMDETAEPKPYHYGLVGTQGSPPSSPSILPSHGRTPSLTPLMAQNVGGAGSTLGMPTSSNGSRPSSSGSYGFVPPATSSYAPTGYGSDHSGSSGPGFVGMSAAPFPSAAPYPSGASVSSHGQSSVSAMSSSAMNEKRPPVTLQYSSSSGSGYVVNNPSGSPTSPEHPRVPLHVANRPVSPTSTITSGRFSEDLGGSSMMAGAAAVAGGSTVVYPTGAQEKQMRRESVNAAPAVRVHQDGGRASGSVSPTPAPVPEARPSGAATTGDLPPPAYTQ